MSPRIPSAAQIRRSPRPVARPHPPCPRLLTLPAPSNIHIHILHRSHPRRFRLASRHRVRRSVTCHPYTAVTCRLNSKCRLKSIHTLLINHHRTQRARMRLFIISKGRMPSPRVPNRLNRWPAQPLCKQPILTIKGTKY